jgi:hypothetical protein
MNMRNRDSDYAAKNIFTCFHLDNIVFYGTFFREEGAKFSQTKRVQSAFAFQEAYRVREHIIQCRGGIVCRPLFAILKNGRVDNPPLRTPCVRGLTGRSTFPHRPQIEACGRQRTNFVDRISSEIRQLKSQNSKEF